VAQRIDKHSGGAVSIAFYLLMALLVGAPALAFVDGALTYGVLAIVAAVSLGLVSIRMQPGEAAHFARLARPLLLLISPPVIWIVLQLVPAGPLAHPIWQSASAALGEPSWGSISVDPGATLLALGHFLTSVGIGVATMALTIDRRRAELCLLVLTMVTSLMALTIILHDLGGFTFLGELGQGVRASYDAAAAVAVVLGLTAADLAVERFETRRQAGMTLPRLIERLAFALETVLVSAIAVAYFQTDALWIAPLAGAATFGLVVMLRRINVGPWVGLGVAAAAAAALAMAIVGSGGFDKSEVALRFARPSVEATATARVLDDAPLLGTGAGTFAAVHALYPDRQAASARTSTAGAILSVEFGRPFFWLAGFLAVALAGVLVRGAFARGRDSFYAAAAGACVVVMLLQALRDASLLGPAMTVLAPITIGLGLGQSVSRRLDQA
jgi:hypothetical protein